ncbi:MAG: iron uptake porin [Xenococcaceae cyanobacterium]
MATSTAWAEAAEESELKQQLVEKSEGMPENSQPFSLEMLPEQPNEWGNLDKPMSQITNVNQLRDVQPGDWAYEALRNLVERYGCIAGYPNGTFRGKRAITRYEFAAGLNSCLNQIERLIATNEAVLREDIFKLQRLMQEFEAELAALGARIDNLEGRVAFLQDHQFSTTTKLSGEVIFSLTGAAGGDKDSSDGFKGDDAQIIFNNRVRLNLTTSFYGEDILITGLQAHNFEGAVDGSDSIQNTLFPTESLLTSGSTKLSFEPEFPRFNPQDISEEIERNSVELYKLLYIFPSGLKNLTLFAGPAAETSDAFPAIIPFSSEGQGAISRFATLNPVIRVSGGTSQDGLASAGGFIWNISDKVDWRALYASVSAPIPTEGPNNLLGAGLFNGSIVASTQLTLTPTNNFDLGLNYAYSYHTLNILATGLTRFSATPLNIPGRTVNEDGTVNVGGILDTPIQIHSVGSTFNWNFTPNVAWTGYFSYFFVNSVAGPSASSNFLSWMTGLSFKDLFKERNTAGLIFGQPLNRVEAGGAAQLTEPNVDRAIPYHLEVFYNYKLTDNISITPGVFVLFNPESNANNDTTTVAVLRTTFEF